MNLLNNNPLKKVQVAWMNWDRSQPDNAMGGEDCV